MSPGSGTLSSDQNVDMEEFQKLLKKVVELTQKVELLEKSGGVPRLSSRHLARPSGISVTRVDKDKKDVKLTEPTKRDRSKKVSRIIDPSKLDGPISSNKTSSRDRAPRVTATSEIQ